MRTIREPNKIESLERLNKEGPDDLFVCCASFEERCLSSVFRFAENFQTRFSIIFVIEEALYRKEIDHHLNALQGEFAKKTIERVLVISCQRQNPMDGLAQFRGILKDFQIIGERRPLITIDISGFTKIYILEILRYLVVELNLRIPRLIHTTQKYSANKLTKGVEQIVTMPHFLGDPFPEKQTLLVLFLGFEPERALTVWEHSYPVKTIALQTNPPRNGNRKYLKYAQEGNSYLLSRPSVEVRDVPPDDPHEVRNLLKSIWKETGDSFNMVIGPFGTKSQTVGVFLFWLEHREVQIVYSFPIDYTKSYLRRKPGFTLLLALGPDLT
jgi:hypothetical protein